MGPETRNCQNCKTDFTIEPEDFEFYKKVAVPPPTFCPKCRLQRRLAYRDERSLYKRECDLCKKSVISLYSPDKPFPVYCKECWHSDKWEAATYGRDYDFNRPFFEQYRELMEVTPRLAIWQRNAVNSDYSNMVGESKNVYLSVSVVLNSENVAYSKSIDASFNILDSFNLQSCEHCYENIDGEKNYNSHYLFLSRNCLDSRFLVDCATCKNCFMSANLRNKEFVIRNEQYGKEEYFVEMAKINLGSRAVVQGLQKEFEELKQKTIYKFANILRSTGTTGNNLMNMKNSRRCFDFYDSENLRYCYRGLKMKDSVDFDYGTASEMMYEYTTGAKNDYNVKFSYSVEETRNAEYVDSCKSCNNVFGCVSLKNKENAILNKVYSEQEFADLRKKIIEQMNAMPYVDKGGRTYRYGEFLPIELIPFAYNETTAREYWPLSKEETLARGYNWRDPEPKTYSPTIAAAAIPDDIATVDESILKEILECDHKGKCEDQCLESFRIIPDELQFYKKHGIPLPVKCPNCRHYDRLRQMPPLDLWHRGCMCATAHPHHAQGQCPNEFETPYEPGRPETVYCEQCYNGEVI